MFGNCEKPAEPKIRKQTVCNDTTVPKITYSVYLQQRFNNVKIYYLHIYVDDMLNKTSLKICIRTILCFLHILLFFFCCAQLLTLYTYNHGFDISSCVCYIVWRDLYSPWNMLDVLLLFKPEFFCSREVLILEP